MKASKLIQRVTSVLLFLVGFIFAILGIFGVRVTVNQTDVNNVIFGLGAIAGFLIEFVPMIFGLIKQVKVGELLTIVRDVVYAVESISNTPDGGVIPGQEKKRIALEKIEKICIDRGITFNKDLVDNLIESVIKILNTVTKG